MYHIMIILYYTIWWFNIAIENGHVKLIYPLNMVIFHSYVSLPEGIIYISHEITIVSLYSIEHIEPEQQNPTKSSYPTLPENIRNMPFDHLWSTNVAVGNPQWRCEWEQLSLWLWLT